MAARGRVKLFLFAAAFLTQAGSQVLRLSVGCLRASSRKWCFLGQFALVGVWPLVLIVVWWRRSSRVEMEVYDHNITSEDLIASAGLPLKRYFGSLCVWFFLMESDELKCSR